jgi:hypothetical protein
MFDVWEVYLDPSVNFENISGLFPLFEGDIPSGSCIAIGHSLTSYVGKKSDKTEDDAQVQLWTNIFFTIILAFQNIECRCSCSFTTSIRFYPSKMCTLKRLVFAQFYIEDFHSHAAFLVRPQTAYFIINFCCRN